MYRLGDFSEADAQTLAESCNEAFGDEIARGLPPFTQGSFNKFHQWEGVKLTVAEDNWMVAGFLVVTVEDEAVPVQVHLVGVEKSLSAGEVVGEVSNTVREGLRLGYVKALHKTLENRHEEGLHGYRLHPWGVSQEGVSWRGPNPVLVVSRMRLSFSMPWEKLKVAARC